MRGITGRDLDLIRNLLELLVHDRQHSFSLALHSLCAVNRRYGLPLVFAQTIVQMTTWPCPACTFENDNFLTICELCATARPAGVGGPGSSPVNFDEGQLTRVTQDLNASSKIYYKVCGATFELRAPRSTCAAAPLHDLLPQ